MKSVWVGLVFGLVLVSAATAQATRTWVSGVGDDANPCSRTAPCKTFAGAISKTAAGGEISVLDPGGFGAVTITKSISIVADGVEGGLLAAGTNGVIVNAGANDVVVLRGLTIEGAGTGINGIRFLAGKSLIVDKCIVSDFRSASGGMGIEFRPSTSGQLLVSDSLIVDNGTGSTGGGIFVRPTGAGSAKAVLDNVRLVGNVLGVRADGGGSTGSISLTVRNSVASSNVFTGITVFTTSSAVDVLVDRSTSVNNGTIGVKGEGANVTIRISGIAVSGNGTGLQSLSSAQILSFGNNSVAGNGTEGAPTGMIGLQ